MRYRKGLILTTVFILSACYFSFISFGETERSVSDSVYDRGAEPAVLARAERIDVVIFDLKTGDQTESVGLDEYALLEVQDSGEHSGSVIPL